MKIRSLCLLSLAACAAAPEPNWEKAGAGQSAVDEAMQQCRTEVRMAPQQHLGTPRPHSSGSPYTPGMERLETRDTEDVQRFQTCMTGKGFTLKP
jgi:hypothetical protein